MRSLPVLLKLLSWLEYVLLCRRQEVSSNLNTLAHSHALPIKESAGDIQVNLIIRAIVMSCASYSLLTSHSWPHVHLHLHQQAAPMWRNTCPVYVTITSCTITSGSTEALVWIKAISALSISAFLNFDHAPYRTL